MAAPVSSGSSANRFDAGRLLSAPMKKTPGIGELAEHTARSFLQAANQVPPPRAAEPSDWQTSYADLPVGQKMLGFHVPREGVPTACGTFNSSSRLARDPSDVQSHDEELKVPHAVGTPSRG